VYLLLSLSLVSVTDVISGMMSVYVQEQR